MNTTPQPDTPIRRISRWEIHCEYWLMVCFAAGILAVFYRIQRAIDATATTDLSRTYLFAALLWVSVIAFQLFLASPNAFQDKRPEKPIDFRSKRSIICYGILSVIVLAWLVSAIIDYLSPTPPTHRLAIWLWSWLPASTPPWEAFWQSIALNRLLVAVAGVVILFRWTRPYHSRLKTIALQKNDVND